MKRTWAGRELTLNNINHTNCCDYIGDVVLKMSDMRSLVANM